MWAPEPRADAHLPAPVAPERRVQLLQQETVLQVTEMGYLVVPHRCRRRVEAGTLLPIELERVVALPLWARIPRRSIRVDVDFSS